VRRFRILTLMVVALALVAAGCGGDDLGVSARGAQTDPTSTSTSSSPSTSSPDPTSTTSPATGTKTVAYRGITLEVPRDWVVYQLDDEPKRCVRYDQHAVYLGSESTTPDCPAVALGRVETLQIQDLGARTKVSEGLATNATSLNGFAVRLDPNTQFTHALTAVLPDQNLLVTVTIGNDPALANRILSSLAHAS